MRNALFGTDGRENPDASLMLMGSEYWEGGDPYEPMTLAMTNTGLMQ